MSIWEETCEALIPAGFQPGFVFLPCLGASAQAQDLADDDRVHITLLGLGTAGGDDTETPSFILRVENRSEETIPVQIGGVVVNGIYVNNVSNSYQLASHKSCLLFQTVAEYWLRSSGITGISDISIQILTSEEEDTGGVRIAGGSYYPVVLTENAGNMAEPDRSNLLFENEWIRVYHISHEGPDQSSNGQGSYTWTLLFRNLSDIDLSIDSGYTPDEDIRYSFDIYEIGAGTWKYVEGKCFYTVGQEPDPFMIRLTGFTAGKGKLLFPETDPIVLPAD